MAVLEAAGPKIFVIGKYSSSFSPLKLLSLPVISCIWLLKQRIHGDRKGSFCLRSVRLSLFTWSVKLLLSPITVGAGGQAWLSLVVFDSFNVLNFVSYPVFTIGNGGFRNCGTRSRNRLRALV